MVCRENQCYNGDAYISPEIIYIYKIIYINLIIFGFVRRETCCLTHCYTLTTWWSNLSDMGSNYRSSLRRDHKDGLWMEGRLPSRVKERMVDRQQHHQLIHDAAGIVNITITIFSRPSLLKPASAMTRWIVLFHLVRGPPDSWWPAELVSDLLPDCWLLGVLWLKWNQLACDHFSWGRPIWVG